MYTNICAFQDASVLDPVLHERAEQLFRCLLRYVTEMLVWEKYYALPGDLQPRYCQDICYGKQKLDNDCCVTPWSDAGPSGFCLT